MACLCQISLRQLERHFAKSFKLPPRDWVRELRCRRAVDLLVAGYTSKAVVAELKFANASQLCHDFRRIFGDSPRVVARAQGLEKRLRESKTGPQTRKQRVVAQSQHLA